MTWRIKSLILYQRNGSDRRTLNFRTHGINIITGDSQTGKSAVLDILDYVLMSKSCPIPKGIIRRAVSHVGGHFIGPKGEILVIRPLPEPGKKVSSHGWYKIGKDLKFPNEIPKMNINRDGIRDILSTFTEISGANVLSNSREPWAETQVEANIRHAAPLIFQPQDIIANRYVSVPGLDSEHHRRDMLDSLPFLLGIESAEILAARSRLRRLRSELRAHKMKGKEKKQLRSNTFARGHRLWLEAQSLGLIDDRPPKSVPGLLNTLKNLRIDEDKRFDIATTVPKIHELESQELSAREALQHVRAQVRTLRDFENSASVHQDVVTRQINKLSLSELLPNTEVDGTCSVCGSSSFDPSHHRKQLEIALSSLEGVQAVPLRADAKARKARLELEKKLIPLEEEHEAARSKLQKAVATITKNADFLSRDREIDQLLGRISEYARTINVSEVEEDPSDISKLTEDIQRVERKINSIREKRKETQEAINKVMTKLARRMEVEFKHGNASISVQDLSIQVQIDPASDEMTSLAEIGSGANWVSYHLAGVLALHNHFARENSPVPRTLLIDQPSQAWFPAELRITNETGDLKPKREEDANRVRNIYTLLGAMAAQEKFSQIIVMDHAKFTDPWFQEMVLYEWRHGEKLVPDHWDKLSKAY